MNKNTLPSSIPENNMPSYPWNRCPKCGARISEIIDDGSQDEMYVLRWCENSDCSFEWQEVYAFISARVTDTTIHLDNQGNPIDETIHPIIYPKGE